jgi:hypothetical protein
MTTVYARAVETRRMTATRALVQAVAADMAAMLGAMTQPGLGDPVVRDNLDAVGAGVRLVEEALREIDQAESGCGQPAGECMRPCHAIGE